MAESGGSIQYRSGSDSSRSGESQVSLALFEAPPPPRIEFSDRSLPAMIAGGLDYVYRSPNRVTVPSTGAKVRVPLATDSYPVTTYYEATPALAEHAFLKAAVENESKRPMLQGPINIFVNNAFAGEAEMKTTGPGGKIELPLGADEDIRFKRRVIAKTTREGVFSKSDITTYQVVIEVGNYKAKPIRVAVTEVVPKSGHEDLEIELLKIDPKPHSGPDGEGLFRYSVEVPPGKTKSLTLEYKVERPANWQLYQR